MAEIMVCDHPLQVVVHGVDAIFVPGKERPVRDSLVSAAQTQGARIVGDKSTKTEHVVSPKVTDADIQTAIQELLDSHNTRAFGADGSPKVRSIEKLLGANIDAADRDRVWSSMGDGG